MTLLRPLTISNYSCRISVPFQMQTGQTQLPNPIQIVQTWFHLDPKSSHFTILRMKWL